MLKTPMTRSPTIIGTQSHPRMRPPPWTLAREVRVVRHVGEDLSPLRPHDLDPGVRLVVQVEAHAEHSPQVVEAAPADDHQAVSLDHLDGTAVVGHDLLQLPEDRLDRVLEAQRLPEHLRHGQERLGVLSCALELGDVVVDRVEADVLTVDPERHEHHLYVDQLPVLPYATSDPVGSTSLERLVGDVPAFSAEVLVEDEVVDQTPDRLLRRVAEELAAAGFQPVTRSSASMTTMATGLISTSDSARPAGGGPPRARTRGRRQASSILFPSS